MNATEVRKGMVIEMDNDLFLITKYHHVTPGNWRGYVQVTLKNLKSGVQHDKRLRSADKVEQAHLDAQEMEYLYPEGDHYCFMNTETYEQVVISNDVIGELMPYVPLNSRVKVAFYKGEPVTVDLPTSIVLKVEDTEPGMKGNTVNNVFKPAKLETGLEVKVPLFVNPGEYVKIDTRTGEFVERSAPPAREA